MSQIILDFGSGNTCKNNKEYIKRMIDELKAVDTGKHEVIIKWQLFKEAGNNIPLEYDMLILAYNYAKSLGYKTTASVFDKDSLEFLINWFDIPFIKIANNPKYYNLIGEVPRNIPVYVSTKNIESYEYMNDRNLDSMCCVSNYPANIEDYENNFKNTQLRLSISDHTTDFKLFKKYIPYVIEWHYKLEDSTGLDAGEFARTPKQLSEVL